MKDHCCDMCDEGFEIDEPYYGDDQEHYCENCFLEINLIPAAPQTPTPPPPSTPPGGGTLVDADKVIDVVKDLVDERVRLAQIEILEWAVLDADNWIALSDKITELRKVK